MVAADFLAAAADSLAQEEGAVEVASPRSIFRCSNLNFVFHLTLGARYGVAVSAKYDICDGK